jgi:tetratricopeptide (TPR) repeat protein/cellulose biosynthesis protein BcsQ
VGSGLAGPSAGADAGAALDAAPEASLMGVDAAPREGTICTFYSYKGGVGRTQALANVAVLLVRWGYRVLCIDWDLEAPGLHLYFEQGLQGRVGDGVVELMTAHAAGRNPRWDEHLLPVEVPGPGQLELMPAGRLDDGYATRMQALDWEQLYAEHDLAVVIEHLRDELRAVYDFVLVDSRTGITDIGGVCAVQLPDLLVALFTASQQSLNGVLEVVASAAEQRQLLPFERGRVPTLPVITRFEATVEVQLAQAWMDRFEECLADVVAPWSHRGVPLDRLLPLIRIPHVAHWSFGERLPVLEEGTSDPAGIGYAFETLAALVAHRLEGSALLVANRRAYIDAVSAFSADEELEFDAFVIGSIDQQAYVQRLVEGLQRAGLRVLVQDDPTAPGGAVRDVREHVQRARNLVLVVGEEAASLEVEARAFLLATATQATPRRLMPVLRADPDLLPAIASGYVYIDGRSASIKDVALDVADAIQTQLFEFHRDLLTFNDPRTLEAARRLAQTLVAKRSWDSAVPLLEKIVAQHRRVQPEAQETADAIDLLATAMYATGRYAEARALQEEIVSWTQRTYGDESEAAADALHDLAGTLMALGETSEAIAAAARAVAILQDLLGAEHRATLAARVTQAGAMRAQGDTQGAMALVEESLAVQRRVLGPDDPDTLASISYQSRMLLAAGKIETAAQLAQDALETLRRTLGDDHPATLIAMNDLAHVRHQQGAFEEAEALESQVLAVRERTQGPEHPDTLTAIGNIATTRYERGDLHGARELEERVLETRRRILGDEHPQTLNAIANYAETLHELGDLDEARALHEQVLELRRRALGEEHPATLASLGNLAKTLFRLDDFDGARELGERALEVSRRVFGGEHPTTLKAMANVAATMHAQGDLSGARALEEHVLEVERRIWGEQHPETIASMANLATTLYELDDLAGARALEEAVLTRTCEIYGADSVMAAGAMSRLAATLRRLDDLEAARDLAERALSMRTRLLGPLHRDTVASTVQLAETARQLGDEETAAALLRRLQQRDEPRESARQLKGRDS